MIDSPGVRFTISGMLLLAWSLVLERLIPAATSQEMFNWLWRFNWTCWLIGAACVIYGVARIFTIERN